MPYIASGTYGCVFKPLISCTDHDKIAKPPRNTVKVGKIFTNEDEAKHEVENQLVVLKKIDPRSKFTAKYIEKCYVSYFKMKDEVFKCPYTLSRHPIQLVYEYGGISYDQIIKKNNPSGQKLVVLLKALEPVFDGVSRMHQKGYVHQDIKPHNILYSSRHKHAILIDFGIMKAVKNIYTEENSHVLTHNYPYFPPEFKIHESKSWIDFKRSVDMNFSTGALKEIKSILKQSGVNFAEDVKATYTHRYRDTSKIDSYSLGIVIAMLLNWSDVSLPRDSILITQIQTLLTRLCHQDSKKRFNVYEAAKEYRKFIQNLAPPRKQHVHTTK